MTITLPDAMRADLEAKAKASGFASVNHYVAYLVITDRPEDEGDADAPVPPELIPRNRAELERMIEEGMNSGPPIRVTPEFWEDMRRRLEERLAARNTRQAPTASEL